ncbi:MAG TPA: CvpA family protein [Burkholderiaceae bacterium]|mgnify:CR=1 FL=1|nr:CvpA family protein [Burkholderiaceae bacterium]
MSLPPLTGWDWFVLLTLGLSTGYGFFTGLARTVFGLASWVAALIGTPLLAPMVIASTGWTQHAMVVWVILFLVLFLLVRMIGGALAKGLRASGLGGVDRLTGALFGVARAAILIVLVVGAAHLMGADRGAGWLNAFSRPLLEAIVHQIEPFLPQRLSGIRTT